jgi:flagellar assembly protein FliH
MSLHAHASVQRFAFDRIFALHASDPKVNTGDLELEIAALQAEIALLKSDQGSAVSLARAQGFEAGLAQARAEREVALLSAVDALHAGIEVIDAHFTEVSDRVAGEATEIALAAADMLAGRALEAAPTATIDAAIGRVLGQVARGTELQVRVHPDLVADIEEKIAVRQSQDRRKLSLSVAADDTLALGDAVIGWEEGGLTLSAAARREAIAAELESLLPR